MTQGFGKNQLNPLKEVYRGHSTSHSLLRTTKMLSWGGPAVALVRSVFSEGRGLPDGRMDCLERARGPKGLASSRPWLQGKMVAGPGFLVVWKGLEKNGWTLPDMTFASALLGSFIWFDLGHSNKLSPFCSDEGALSLISGLPFR